jgi:hypothetical protein
LAPPSEANASTNVEAIAKTAVNESLLYAAAKCESGDVDALRAKLADADDWALSYLAYACASNIAQAIALLDENVLEAFVLGVEGDDVCTTCFPVTLVLRVTRHTAALESLVSNLEDEIRSYLEQDAALSVGVLLEIRVVEDEDVRARRGLGAAIRSMWTPALKVWERK